MATLIVWIKNLFTNKKIGCILAVFAKKAAAAAVKQIMDPENQRKAYELVKKLITRKDMTSKEKAEVFSLQMLDWSQTYARNLSDSSINCLREMALAAAKAEEQIRSKNTRK